MPCIRKYRRRYRKIHKSGKIRRKLIVFAVATAILMVISEIGLSDISPALTEQTAEKYVNSCVNEAVRKQIGGSGDDYVQRDFDVSGKIVALSADAGKLNELKTKLTADITKRLNRKASVHIPIGSLTNIAMLNGRGFSVPVKLSFEGTVDVSFDSEFTSAGINQSRHRVVMTVRSEIVSVSKRFYSEQEIITTAVIAENIIIGETPSIVAKG